MFIYLYRHFLPHVGLYDVEEARGVDGALHVQVGDAERRVGGPVRPQARLLHRRGILDPLVPQGPYQARYERRLLLQSWQPS